MKGIDRQLVIIATGGLVGLIVLYMVYQATYAGPRDVLRGQIAEHREAIDRLHRTLEHRTEIARTLKAYADLTLGDRVELVDHELRTRLNRAGEGVGLRSLSVTTSRPALRQSPARLRYSGRGELRRELRDRIDFVELQATVAGEGSFEEVLRLIHRIESEPWIKRIDRVRLDPRDNGEHFNVNINLTTLFIPGQAPSEPPGGLPGEPPGDSPAFAEGGLLASLVESNPFRIPPPPAEPPQQVVRQEEQPRPSPPPFAYNEWMVTGVVHGPWGVEVWLRNRHSQERKRLSPGERLHEAELVAANGEVAEFRLGDEQFLVSVGRTLDDRSSMPY